MEQELEQLGFSRSEAKVYLALLEVGPTTAGEIIKKCGLHRNIVYESLNKFLDRKLVSETLKGGKKFFTPLDPSIILRQEKQKLEIAENLMPRLVGKLKKEQQQIIIYEGSQEYRDFQYEKIKQMPEKGTYYVIGAAKHWFSFMGGDFYAKYEGERLERKIKVKVLYYREQYEKNRKLMLERRLADWRVIGEDLETPAYTIIWPDSINIAIFSEPLINIEIKNKEVVEAYLNYFNLLWKLGKKEK